MCNQLKIELYLKLLLVILILFIIKTFLYCHIPTYVKSIIVPKIALKAGIQNNARQRAKCR